MLPDLMALRRRLCGSRLDATTALVEAAILYRCVAPHHSAAAAPAAVEPLTCFDSAAAAHRFAATMRYVTTHVARVETRELGIRHRHQMHAVACDGLDADTLHSALADGWRRAANCLSEPDARPQATVPVAIWRALLLTSTPVRNTVGLRLRIRDPELLALAVRAARALRVPTRSRAGSGLGVLCVDDCDHVTRLLDRLLPRVPALRPSLPVAAGQTTAARTGRSLAVAH